MHNLTKLQNNIFRLLCVWHGEELNQREIAKALKASPAGVAKALKEMKANKLVIIQTVKTMNLKLISLDWTKQTILLKKLENLKQLYEVKFVQYLEERFPGTTIILFGSYDRGEDTITSDIDIAIIESKQKIINRKPFEKKLKRTININFYNSFKDVHKELKENLCNGTVLIGGIEL